MFRELMLLIPQHSLKKQKMCPAAPSGGGGAHCAFFVNIYLGTLTFTLPSAII